VLISGANVPIANLARLAIRLRHFGETELSVRISLAIDMNRRELRLTTYERAQLLDPLGDGPDEFDELRGALEAEALARDAAALQSTRLSGSRRRRGRDERT
jgi:hypothetical protein